MQSLLLLTAVLLSCTLYLRLRLRVGSIGPSLPDAFLIGLWIYFLGALFSATMSLTPFAAQILQISAVTLVSAQIASALFLVVFAPAYESFSFGAYLQSLSAGPLERLLVALSFALSILVCCLFVYAVLSNSVVGALLSVASLVSDSSLLDARKAITSGTEGYFAPGYVKQFRDIAIPLFLVATLALPDSLWVRVFRAVSISMAFVAMALSGQRLVFFIAFAVVFLGWASMQVHRPAGETKRGARFTIITAVVVGLGLMVGLTVLLGRTDELGSGLSLLFGVVSGIVERIFLLPPYENGKTFDVWGALAPSYGASWLADLQGILPGVSESFSNILHAATGGSLQGNSPLGLSSDVFLAWGWVGSITMPFAYVLCLYILDNALVSESSPVLFATRTYLFVALPICYSPFLFLLYGGLLSILLLITIKVIRSGSGGRPSPGLTDLTA